ncbi:MAG: hypothetical protein U0S48_14650 [Solirubrobacteraceae bacterium]
MDDRQQAGVRMLVERIDQRVVGDDLPPGTSDLHDVRAVADGHRRDARAEEAGVPDDHRVAGRDQVGDAGLHPGHARGLQRDADVLARDAVDGAQHRNDFVHPVMEGRVEVPEHRLAHDVEHGRLHVGRSRAREQTRRCHERRCGRDGRRGWHWGSSRRADLSARNFRSTKTQLRSAQHATTILTDRERRLTRMRGRGRPPPRRTRDAPTIT